MNKYYYNGKLISEIEAAAFFMATCHAKWELSQPELIQAWGQCQMDEAMRDTYLPPELEIVQQ